MLSDGAKYGHFFSLKAGFGRRYQFKRNLRQLAISIGVGLVLTPRRGLLRSEYTAQFTGSTEAVQAFKDAVAIWRR